MEKLSVPAVKERKRFTMPSGVTLTLMTVPFVILVVMFCYVPLLGWSMAFVKYVPGMSIFKSAFVGLKNFSRIFGFGSDLFRVLRNTLAMSFLGIAFSPAPIILAILLMEVSRSKLRKFLQTAVSIPNFISFVTVFSIFLSLFSTDGLVNQILTSLHLISSPTTILNNPSLAWIFQTFVTMWKTMGWSAIIYMSSIAGIDQELYEAAKVDGASRFRQILHVTVPGVMPTYIVLLVLFVGNALNGAAFEQTFVFYNPAVHSTIETLDYYVYRIGMTMYDFSFSTAVGMFKSVVSIILLFSVNRIAKRITGTSII